MSRTGRWVAHAPRVLVSDLSTLTETRANREKFAMARAPSPAREMRALPNPLASARIRKRMFGVSSLALLIEREVWLQHIDSGITEHSQITAVGVFLDELADFVFAQSPRFSDTRDLELGITQGDLWIEAAAGCSNCIRRHRAGFAQTVFRAIRRHAFLDRL